MQDVGREAIFRIDHVADADGGEPRAVLRLGVRWRRRHAIAQRIDVEALVEQTDLGAVIARSSSGIAGDLLDAVRSRTVGADEVIARWVARLRRRPYTGPPGPPAGLRAMARS